MAWELKKGIYEWNIGGWYNTMSLLDFQGFNEHSYQTNWLVGEQGGGVYLK